MVIQRYAYTLLLVACYTCMVQARQQIAIVFVVDQLSHHALNKVKPHLTGGLKTLLTNGIVYEQALYPYANPTTGPGHNSLQTGATPNIHGIIDNNWFNAQGEKVECDDDSVEKAAVFAPQGFYDYGKSGHNCMVDGISDQLMIASQPQQKHSAYAISIKSRAAIGMAGKLGKALWLDEQIGWFTSSKAYFEQLPQWVTTFNQEKKLDKLTSVYWKLAYPSHSAVYKFKNIDNYEFASAPSMIGKQLSIERPADNTEKDPYEIFARTPEANKITLDFSQRCVEELVKQKNSKILLWIGLSSLDKVGHLYGPDSLEYIDTIYHLDLYIKQFMQHIQQTIVNYSIAFILTADHGSMEIPELLEKQQFNLAQRIVPQELTSGINEHITQNYGISDIIKKIDTPTIYLDEQSLKTMPAEMQQQIIHEIGEYLKKQKGIYRVWTTQELSSSCHDPYSFEQLFKNIIYPGRSSTLLYQIAPYTYMGKYATGTNHVSPYDYDRHVPFIWLEPARRHTKIYDQISPTQLAKTLAYWFNIPSPSASLSHLLPTIIQE